MNRSLHNRKYLEKYRKELRNNATKAESMLWKALRSRQLEGRKFRRQQSIDNFIVDFYCPQEKLIVELDGEVHNNPVSENYDDDRTEKLEELGFTVLRFENKLVFEQLDMIMECIKASFHR
ncbi:endonuclease domain-containing protein [Flavobacteriaceae bacterium F89]|uniref:Endonuclease domain-containing protein n=1 Tax=Cerina litoralis TaxID=2874477 RepID=A0AAE3EX27_9FLAO|nr:endonuclease domain-containing protein [Cerina litoralis]MCG2461709.1 endonuclease domain-containing protein [Cerina litoralis]